MRKNFGAKSYLYPKPVLIIATYGEDGTPDAMKAAWGCIADTDQIALYLSASHQTVRNILARKAFTVSVGTAQYETAWCPARSSPTRWPGRASTPPGANLWMRPSSTSCPWPWSAG